ncbi:hypothetical protein IFM89_002680 [Coptis chinensis]|uniref:Uncharacterized protein n=1 Tax=Coptis chinensis TaxID=261450 RepID=A0A835IM71_9MAGN|nr:hypothetical protein IFM89_002680 [Coptis chinensis]
MDMHSGSQNKKQVVFIVGATGTGQSTLSIDLAKCFPAEIVNSDKMQVYQGLDIITKKVPEEEQYGIPHHPLGVLDANADFSVSDFCFLASRTIELTLERDRLPIVAGGSNTYIEALVDDEKLGVTLLRPKNLSFFSSSLLLSISTHSSSSFYTAEPGFI